MNVISSLMQGVCAFFFAVGTLMAAAAVEVGRFLEDSLEKYERAKRERQGSGDFGSNRHQVIYNLRQLNGEIRDLEAKGARDGRLVQYEREKLGELVNLRSRAYGEYEFLRSAEIAGEMRNHPGQYGRVVINGANTHIIQYHMGQTTFGKTCPSCGRPMVLQFRRGSMTIGADDIFWGCTGWYSGACSRTSRFTMADQQMLTRMERPEFQITSSQLARIVENGSVQNAVIGRVREHLAHEDDNYFCPHHNLPLVLREKNDKSGGVLDMFFLACPFSGREPNPCTYLTKLKSPAQLAAFLEKKTGRGIL